MLKLQLILHENITDIYKLDYNWNQHTSMLMERCPDLNPLKYSRDVYSSHWGKKANCLHSNLIEEGNTPICIVGVRTAALQAGEQQLSPLGQRPSGLLAGTWTLAMKKKSDVRNKKKINIAEEDDILFAYW